VPAPTSVELTQTSKLPNVMAHPDYLDPWLRLRRAVPVLLQRALPTRLAVARGTLDPLPAWVVDAAPPNAHNGSGGLARGLTVGLRLHADEALKPVVMGPAADDEAAAQRFRSLWGARSELRRFKDSSICEAVVVNLPPTQRHRIVPTLVAMLLQRHFGIELPQLLPETSGKVAADALTAPTAPLYWVDQLDGVLEVPAGRRLVPPVATVAKRAGAEGELGEQPYQPAPIHHAFEGLGRALKVGQARGPWRSAPWIAAHPTRTYCVSCLPAGHSRWRTCRWTL